MATKTSLINFGKILLMSSGLIFIAIILSLTLPHLLTSPHFPALWFSFKACLRPPYLYFIINLIIVAIVVTSRLHHHAPPPLEGSIYAPPTHVNSYHRQHDVVSVQPADQLPDYGAVSDKIVEVDEVVGDHGLFDGVVSVKEVVEEEVIRDVVECAAEYEDEVVEKRDTWTPSPPLMRQPGIPGYFMERPPASTRFGHHRRLAKAGVTQGGKALRRVAKPKKHETLESTWKAITEGRHIPLTRHLKKTDAFENHDLQMTVVDDDSSSLPDAVKKSQTHVHKLRKEPSLGQDELNRRVEAFINKFNQEMRLQRQQSAQQFMEMINRAA